ncbi:MAG: FAD-dependent oxidoreductase [Kiritimatiellia bacterium]
MNEYALKQNSIPLDDSYDVIVAGGGPAGCTAAAAAAREGARTLLVEATGALGGMGTSGLVPAWCPFTDKEKIIYGGMGEQILKKCIAGMPHVPPDNYDWTPIDPELLKRLYDELLSENGAEVLFNSVLAGVESEKPGRADTLIVANKRGLRAYRAKAFVDATGDGDLAARAGADYEKGDEKEELQPVSLCFTIANVDTYGFEYCGTIRHGPKPHIMDKIVESGKYPEIPDRHACNALVGPGTVGFNAGHMWQVDNTDPETVSSALVKGRRIAAAFRDALAEFFPSAFGNGHLVQTGTLIGARETRRITGDYVLKLDDFLSLRSFPDEICRNCYFIDIHHTKADAGTEKEGHHPLGLKKGESHGIPYRCLTPAGIENVTVAGRCISCDRDVQGSVRVMPVCLCTGEAAGAATAMAAGGGGDVHAVDTAALREKLRNHGAYLPEVEAG